MAPGAPEAALSGILQRHHPSAQPAICPILNAVRLHPAWAKSSVPARRTYDTTAGDPKNRDGNKVLINDDLLARHVLQLIQQPGDAGAVGIPQHSALFSAHTTSSPHPSSLIPSGASLLPASRSNIRPPPTLSRDIRLPRKIILEFDPENPDKSQN